MVVWIALGVAVLVAVVVLGFCGYELTWKSARLRRDLTALQALATDLTRVQTQLAAAGARAASVRVAGAGE